MSTLFSNFCELLGSANTCLGKSLVRFPVYWKLYFISKFGLDFTGLALGKLTDVSFYREFTTRMEYITARNASFVTFPETVSLSTSVQLTERVPSVEGYFFSSRSTYQAARRKRGLLQIHSKISKGIGITVHALPVWTSLNMHLQALQDDFNSFVANSPVFSSFKYST